VPGLGFTLSQSTISVPKTKQHAGFCLVSGTSAVLAADADVTAAQPPPVTDAQADAGADTDADVVNMETFTFLHLTKQAGTPTPDAAARLAIFQAQQDVLTAWFAKGPQLSTAKQDSISAAFSAASLPLKEAYEAIFDVAEKAEYTFEFFLSDLEETMPEVHALGEMGSADAVAFLEANQ
jgi:hypothetical protein